MRIVWHGHSCFEVHDGVTVVTDPHDGKSIGIKTPKVKADVILISHDHFDHNCSRIVKGEPTVVREPGERTVKGVKLTGIPTFHDTEGGAKRGKNIVFKFEIEGVRFCHCGDLGHMLSDEQIKVLGPVDVLFVPVGGVITLDGGQARELIKKIRPRIAIPMHFRMVGLSISINTLEPFLEGIPQESILMVGNEVDFVKEELLPTTEYWVFSP
jgi:L-ascorbate metabolism protein UlaG (beta-lactamase superfamily)